MTEPKPPPRVLLVEDEPTSQAMLVALLSRLGVVPDTATNADEVRAALAKQDYKVIIMDVMIPGATGIELSKEIRARERVTGKRTLIVALTALNTPEDKKNCIDAGMDGYFSKPYDRQKIQDFFKNLLR